ncbi:mimecan [Ailuropoda melanoleuca]|uniref:Mimecan n=4 Tax=Ursidae TaxID=9632 RepID=G1M4F9_AILME|nr:mimecan [Ailuropoda melanoleuca]XP_008689088.1 mimecan [Ursus maritimus]XP_026374916.1 mimecan isoform X1 [Ursus arctos]
MQQFETDPQPSSFTYHLGLIHRHELLLRKTTKSFKKATTGKREHCPTVSRPLAYSLPVTLVFAAMKALQSTCLLLLFVPLIKPAPPTQQDSRMTYDYGTDDFEETLFSQDFEDKYLDGKNIKEKETIIPEEKSLQLQRDERVTPPPLKKENDEMPTCLLCVCLSGSVYCEEVDIDAVPPLPKESAYLYARFNKIKKLTAKDFADIPNLRRLDFTGNLIEDIEDGTFSKLSLLEELTLAENQLLKLPVLPPKLTLFNAKYNKIKSRGIKANTFKKLNHLSFLYLDHNALESVPLNLPESLRVIHLQFNNITSITDDTFCKANDTRYIRDRIEEIRLEGNPIVLGKHPNSFICLKRLPVGSYF